MNRSSAAIRPSLRNPIFTRPVMFVRARPMQLSSSRLMRIITGALAFLDRSAGIAIETAPPPLLPKPPPVYSHTSTTRDGSMPTHRATGSTVRTTLCVDPCR
jgi:hypothetical protein